MCDDTLDLFLAAISELTSRIEAETAVTAGQGSGLLALLARARRGGWGRTGDLPGGWHYDVHGSGARFIARDGRVVDVDADYSSSMVWDVWRLQLFAESIGRLESPATLDPQVAQAIERGAVSVVREGWFEATRR